MNTLLAQFSKLPATPSSSLNPKSSKSLITNDPNSQSSITCSSGYKTSSSMGKEPQCRQVQLKELSNNNSSSLKGSKVSRRLAIEFVGISSVLLHVCPAHGAVQLMGYSGATGPDNWGSMSPSYGACSYGKLQSPIEIAKENIVIDQNLGPLDMEYNDTSASLINNGFNVELKYGNDAGGVIIDGRNYTLKQMHWHSPSEHIIDGVRYAAELHLVHSSTDGNISVVAILYKYGAPDPLLYQIKDQIDQLANSTYAGYEGARIPIKLVRSNAIMYGVKTYFRYAGSLTTPPCSEKVIWNILKEVREISKEQVAALKAPLYESCKNNSRPIQLLNGRYVGMPAAS